MDAYVPGIIRNIFAVGRNYGQHAAELGNAVPEQPMLFMKPSHAIAVMDGGELRLPDSRGRIHYETELVVRIARSYERGIRVDELIGQLALGIDFTLRDVQDELKRKGHPWLVAKGFPSSAPITEFRAFPGIAALSSADFGAMRNGVQVQRGNSRDMIFDLQTIVDYCAEQVGIGEGDLLFTGTPAGVGPVADGDTFELFYGGDIWGRCVVRLG